MTEINTKATIRRLKQALDIDKDLELAQCLGKKRSTVSMWKKQGIPQDSLKYICEKKKININWVLTGKGEMCLGLRVGETGATWLPPGLDSTTQQILALLKNMPDEQKKEILHYIEEKTLLKKLLAEHKKKPKEV